MTRRRETGPARGRCTPQPAKGSFGAPHPPPPYPDHGPGHARDAEPVHARGRGGRGSHAAAEARGAANPGRRRAPRAAARDGTAAGGRGHRQAAVQVRIPARCRPLPGWPPCWGPRCPRARPARKSAWRSADARTGKVLYAENGRALATPASTTKVATAVAALAVLGPDARFTTSVRKVSGGIVLVGGGDPTLAVNGLPLLRLPSARHAGRARGQHGPGAQGPGRHPCAARLRHFPLHRPSTWHQDGPTALITTGNVTPIVSLEADQGRLYPGRCARRLRRRGQLHAPHDGPGCCATVTAFVEPAPAGRHHGQRQPGGKRPPRPARPGWRA